MEQMISLVRWRRAILTSVVVCILNVLCRVLLQAFLAPAQLADWVALGLTLLLTCVAAARLARKRTYRLPASLDALFLGILVAAIQVVIDFDPSSRSTMIAQFVVTVGAGWGGGVWGRRNKKDPGAWDDL